MSNTQNKYFFLFGIFIFFGLTFFASPVSAATYYCDSLINCNDAIANANSGDVVKVTEDLIKHGCPFSGITFSSSGIIFDCQGYHITDDTCSGYSGTGINLGAYDFNTVQNCKISRFSTGINLAPGSSNNIISNNTVISNGQGIFINIIIGSAISNNTIIGNTVESISDVGIRASGFSSMPDNTIIDNIVRFGSNVGMYLHGPASGTVVDNNVTNNDRYGLYMLNYNRGNNIFLVNSNIFCGHSLKDIWENNSTPPNTGDNNTCDIRQNWHDNDATRCTYCCTNTGCYDDFVNYCSGDQLRKHRMYHGVCTGNVCIETELGWTDDQLVQNCNTQDGWYDIGGHYGSVCNGNQLCKNQNQEYRNYTCSGSSCTYLVTNTRIIKVDCAVCDDSNPATIDTCEAGACVYNTACSTHSSSACYDNDEYWYDSCGVREDKKQECGDNSTGAWGANYCKADDSLYHSRVVHQRGCAGSSCYDNTSTEEELVETCDDSNPATIDTCVSGSCVYTPISPPTLTISVNPTAILSGEQTTVTWSSTNTTDCVGSLGGAYPTSGSFPDNPASLPRTYTLTCTGPGGSITDSATVTEKSSSTLSLSVVDLNNVVVDDYNPIYPGESVTVEWIPDNMASCSGIPTDLGFSSTPGSVVHTPIFSNTPPPPYEYTYTINCTGLDSSLHSESVTIKSTRDNGICDPGETYPTAPKDCPFTYELF
ncbi:right-handed parallel beta-helix repeat-containing protein [Patescibacteria group bacterium]|nr:right-handed parallel beta-helix repeat-containing protein [Patescibacteria group bacterium]